MKKFQRGFTIIELFGLILIPLWIAAIVGWGWNIVKIIESDFAHMTGLLVVRLIGVFLAPLGAVLGYF